MSFFAGLSESDFISYILVTSIAIFYTFKVMPIVSVWKVLENKSLYITRLWKKYPWNRIPVLCSNFVFRKSLCTGKSLSEALLFGKDGENMLCTEIVLNVKNNFCTQHVLPMFWAWNFHVFELVIKWTIFCHIVG